MFGFFFNAFISNFGTRNTGMCKMWKLELFLVFLELVSQQMTVNVPINVN